MSDISIELVNQVAAARESNLINEIYYLREQVKVLREALEDIKDYWNLDNNETAMNDACWHAIEIADISLEQTKPKDGE